LALALLYQRGIRLPPVLCVGILAVGVSAVWWSAPGMPPSGLRVVSWGIPAALIVAGAMFRRGAPAPTRRGILDLLGDASYSIYLIHPLVVSGIIRWWSFGLNEFPMWQVIIAGATLMLALSVASFYIFERPTTRAMQDVLIGLAARALGITGATARPSGGVMRWAAAERPPTWSVSTDESRVRAPAVARQELRRR
jgi:exopolysaccharide production protein ExoZ